jgi:hypothetical protein
MSRITRRAFLGSAAAASILPAAVSAGGLPIEARGKSPSTKLLDYFAAIANELLRPAEGYLKHPSISPTLPGKEYSTELWDWDTYWTARGLFRLSQLLSLAVAGTHRRACPGESPELPRLSGAGRARADHGLR